MAKAGTRIIFDVAVVIERGPETIAKIVHARERLGQADDGGGDCRCRSTVGRQTRRGLEKRDHEDQIATVEDAAGNPGSIDDGAHIRAVDRGWTDFGQGRARLTSRFDRLTDCCEHGERFGGQCPFPTHGGPRLLR